MTNYRITCLSAIVCSFSACSDFREKQSLCAYMYSSMLYPTMKSDSSMSVPGLKNQMFVKIGAFLPVKNYRINIVISLFLHEDNFSFAWKTHIQIEKFLLNIFMKKGLKHRLYLSLEWDIIDQAKMEWQRHPSSIFWQGYLKYW